MTEGRSERAEIVLLRGHHLLCIHGFRGYGYSDEFVAGMWRVVNRLRETPDTIVEVVDAADEICRSCPHLLGGQCQKGGEESAFMRTSHDRRVLDWLGLKAGQRIPWSEAVEKVRSLVRPKDLPQLCHDCEWLSAGYCAEAMKALSSRLAP